MTLTFYPLIFFEIFNFLDLVDGKRPSTKNALGGDIITRHTDIADSILNRHRGDSVKMLTLHKMWTCNILIKTTDLKPLFSFTGNQTDMLKWVRENIWKRRLYLSIIQEYFLLHPTVSRSSVFSVTFLPLPYNQGISWPNSQGTAQNRIGMWPF